MLCNVVFIIHYSSIWYLLFVIHFWRYSSYNDDSLFYYLLTSSHPNTGLVANYCRLGGSTKALRPWCYTMEKETRWDYCDIPKCPGIAYSGVKITHFRVKILSQNKINQWRPPIMLTAVWQIILLCLVFF